MCLVVAVDGTDVELLPLHLLAGVGGGVQHDVVQLDVAVDQPRLVDRGEALEAVRHELDGHRLPQRPDLLQHLPSAHAYRLSWGLSLLSFG